MFVTQNNQNPDHKIQSLGWRNASMIRKTVSKPRSLVLVWMGECFRCSINDLTEPFDCVIIAKCSSVLFSLMGFDACVILYLGKISTTKYQQCSRVLTRVGQSWATLLKAFFPSFICGSNSSPNCDIFFFCFLVLF